MKSYGFNPEIIETSR